MKKEEATTIEEDGIVLNRTLIVLSFIQIFRISSSKKTIFTFLSFVSHFISTLILVVDNSIFHFSKLEHKGVTGAVGKVSHKTVANK